MRIGIGVMLGIGLVLAGCGGGRNDNAATACSTEIGKRMNGRGFTLDLQDLAAHAKEESADTLLLTSTVVLDKGLPSEQQKRKILRMPRALRCVRCAERAVSAVQLEHLGFEAAAINLL